MKIQDILDRNSLEIGAELISKDEVFDRLISLHQKNGSISDSTRFKRDALAREGLASSALSNRIALSCVTSKEATRTSLTALTLKDGVDFNARDKRRVNLIFMIAGDEESPEPLELKTRLLRLLMDSSFSAGLSSCKNADEFLSLLREKEKARFPEEKRTPNPDYDCSKFLKKKHKWFRMR